MDKFIEILKCRVEAEEEAYNRHKAELMENAAHVANGEIYYAKFLEDSLKEMRDSENRLYAYKRDYIAAKQHC